MRLAIGSDHAGFEYKEKLKTFLISLNHELKDFGPANANSVDYPDFAHPVAKAVEENKFDLGVLLCGSANGVAMTANKHQGIRAAVCWTEELAAIVRQHNNANIICIPARFVSVELAEKMLIKFLTTSFEGGRHENRVNKISC